MAMLGLKVPRLDGFIALYYKSCWDIMEEKVTKIVQGFFTLGHMPKGVEFHIYYTHFKKVGS